MDDVRLYAGTLIADLVLSSSRSLKELRAPVRSLQQRLRNEGFTVARIGPADLVQRVFLAIGAVSGEDGVLEERLDAAERIVFASGFEVADLRRLIRVDSFPSGL